MPHTRIFQEDKIPSPLLEVWLEFKQNHLALVALWVMLFFIFLAIFAPIISPYSPNQQHVDKLLLAPAWNDIGDVSFLLGTDDLGRDMLSRLIHGTTITFGLSIVVVFIAMVVGVTIGAIAGVTIGMKSSILNHLLDTVMSIPSLLLAIIIVAIIGPGIYNTMWAISIVLMPQFIHAARDAVREELKKDYVIASQLDGANKFQVLFYSVLPNIYDVIVIQTTFAITTAILDVTALGFLGLGAQQPLAEWGAMLSGGIDFIYTAPSVVALPGLTIFLVLLSTNLVGDGLRSALTQRMAH